MKPSVLFAAALPLLVGCAALLSHAPAAHASRPGGPTDVDVPPARWVQCGDVGIDSFQANLPPTKGVALGHGQSAKDAAMAAAYSNLELQMIMAALAAAVPVPNCPGPQTCPPDTWGCTPTIVIQNPSLSVQIDFQELWTLNGDEVTLCTLTPIAAATYLTGCDPCL